MAQQKLYTEKQVKMLLEKMSLVTERKNLGASANFRHRAIEIDKLLKDITPIELPSDEEKINKFNSFISTEVSLEFLTKEQGERLKWYYETYLVNEIQGGNK